jgi:hypothetical protein
MKKIFIYFNKYTIMILILVFDFLYFYMVLQSGFYGDDSINCNVNGVAYYNSSVMGITFSYAKLWILGGRIFPFAFYVYPLFSVITRFAYKLLIVLSIYLNSLLFGKIIKETTGSKRLQYLFMLVFPILLQYTCKVNNAIFSFHMLMQMTLMWAFLSILTLIKGIDKNSRILIIVSAIFQFLACGTYEVAYPFIFILLLVGYIKTKDAKRTIKFCIPHIIVILSMVILTFYLKSTTLQKQYDGVTINFDIKLMFLTFLKQCSSALPLSSYFIGLRHSGTNAFVDFITGIRVLDIIVLILFILIIILINKRSINEKVSNNNLMLIILSLILFVMPAILISLSQKYQKDLQWGVGHLPSYMQSIGIVFLSIILYTMILKKATKRSSKVFSSCVMGILVILILLNQQVARTSVKEANAFYRWPRENAVNAVKSGILSDVTSKDLIVSLAPFTFDTADGDYFYSAQAKKQLHEMAITIYIMESLKDKKDRIYNIQDDGKKYIINDTGDEKSGYFIVGEKAEIEINDDNTTAKIVSILNPKIYLQGNLKDVPTICFKATDTIGDDNYNVKVLSVSDLQLLSKDKNSKLYELDYDGKIDISSIRFGVDENGVNANDTPFYSKLGKGFTGLEGEGNNRWLWLSNDAELIIYNYQSEDLQQRIKFDIASDYEDISDLKIYINDVLYDYDVNIKGITFDQVVNLKIGANVIKFKTDAQRVNAPLDPREMYLRITKYNLFDIIN